MNAFQKAKKGKVNPAYIILLLVGVAIIALMFNVKFSKEALDTYRNEAILNESRIFETEQETRVIIDAAIEKEHKALDEIQEIHVEAANLQKMIDDMLDNLLASINQEGSSLEDLRKIDYEGAGRDVILDSGWAREFIWFMEFGPEEVIYDPVIKIYYKHTDVSKGIALAEYVAISSLMEAE